MLINMVGTFIEISCHVKVSFDHLFDKLNVQVKNTDTPAEPVVTKVMLPL